MPHEKINFISDVWPRQDGDVEAPPRQLIVGWNEGWVQVSVAPFGWKSTAEWAIVDMAEADIDRAIRTLKRAKRSAFKPSKVPARKYVIGVGGVEILGSGAQKRGES